MKKFSQFVSESNKYTNTKIIDRVVADLEKRNKDLTKEEFVKALKRMYKLSMKDFHDIMDQVEKELDTTPG